jgi:asparagine synthase (glutamine-hydrolysing)
MCGIAGLVGLNGEHVDRALIERMARMVAHRGPDGEGVFVEGNIGLGHRRLAIVDLSSDGAQPMTAGKGCNTVVFNGEIYNYLELRTELQALGHMFATQTDTEVLLAAYAEWGPACVRHFNGMWSFALYDRIRGRLFCSRDRFGEKPFYYMRNSDCFAFGSEIRQLLPLLPKRRANEQALLKFIMGVQSEGLDQSFFEGIRKLPGGHNLILDIRNGDMRIERYYELKIDRTMSRIDDNEAVDQFSAALIDSVRLRMRADVQVATCLSGGLDSSSVATLAASMYREDAQRPFAAITAISEQSSNDESDFAAQVVEHNHMTWHKVRPSYEDFAEALPAIVEAQEEPFPSASIAMQYFVRQTAREKGIPVLLDGQGGDETLLGYERYFAAHYLSEARTHGWFGSLAAMRASSVNNSAMSVRRVLEYFIYFNSSRVRWHNYRRRHGYLRAFPEMFDEVRLYADAGGDIHELQKLEIERTNLPALLRYEDKNAMSHSIETRLPFLDYRLVELSLSLPGSAKISEGWTKHVLRKSMVGKLPNSIVWRRNKLGFEAPEQLWFPRHRASMLEVVRGSELLASVCCHNQLLRDFYQLDALTQWRLYSVAHWERTFEVVA